MKAVAFLSLLSLTAALPTNLATSEPARLVVRDPQRGGGFRGGFGGGPGLGGLLGGLGGLVSLPLDILGGLGGGLIGAAADFAGGLIGGLLPFRVNADGTYEFVENIEDANAFFVPQAAAAPAPVAA
jgi:hypothetical protein